MSVTDSASAEAGAAMPSQPPRENLVRGLRPGVEYRVTEDGKPTLYGRFAVFNEWTEIRSAWEGNFLERIAPGAFSKTIAENRGNMRVLFDHGHDPTIGNKPLGAIRDIAELTDGAHYEVDMFDTAYNRELIPGLEAGVYGASFRFKVMREDFDKKPDRSDFNPDGLPERTITEAKVLEFGPVTFPAYEGATAGVRSLTDEFILGELVGSPDKIRAIFGAVFPSPFTGNVIGSMPADDMPAITAVHGIALAEPTPAEATSDEARREPIVNFDSREDYLEWLTTQL